MTDKWSLGIILAVCVTAVSAGSLCTTRYTNDWGSNETLWCDDGCCGSTDYQYCCYDDSGGVIAYFVIGGFIFLLVATTIAVAIFCCCRKTTGRQGQVLQPTAGTMSVTVPMAAYGAPPTAFGAGQMVYNGAIQTQIATANVAPATTQYWQPAAAQPPPSYDQLAPK